MIDPNFAAPPSRQLSSFQHLLVNYQTKMPTTLQQTAEPEILYLRIEKQNETAKSFLKL
jgi:hypothetical protein